MSALTKLLKKIENTDALDRAAAAVSELLPSALRQHPVVDVLRGKPLGHPAHPAVVLLPIGLYLSSALLDVVPGQGGAARGLVGAGLATTPVAVATGLAEWTTLDQRQQRTAVVHLTANALASTCYLASFVLRGRGRPLSGRLAGLAGASLIGVGGLIGGHLSYSQGAGVRREPV
jgi:uncharacterized membrane protein